MKERKYQFNRQTLVRAIKVLGKEEVLSECLRMFPGFSGKLYKYYPVYEDDSNYTKSNLEKDVIYMQRPSNFNDPFDSSMGYDLGECIKYAAPIEFRNKLSENAFTFYEQILKQTEDVKLSEQVFSEMCEEVRKIEGAEILISRIRDGDNVSNGEVLWWMLSHSNQILQCFKRVSEKNGYLNEYEELMQKFDVVSLLKQCSELSETQVEDISNLLLDTDENFLNVLVTIMGMLGGEYENNLIQINNGINNLENAIKNMYNIFDNSIGVTCFCETPNNILMWSHYADKHKGICVEYDFAALRDEVQGLLLPIKYSKERPVLDMISIYDQKEDDANRLRDKFLIDFVEDIFIKSHHWIYEDEWRLLLLQTRDDRLVRVPCASKIYVGVNISVNNLKRIKTIADSKGIPLVKAKMRNDRFDIEFVDVEENENMEDDYYEEDINRY